MDARQRSAFEKGTMARKLGKPSTDDPYHHATSIQSKNHWAWAKGWAKEDGALGGASHDKGGWDG